MLIFYDSKLKMLNKYPDISVEYIPLYNTHTTQNLSYLRACPAATYLRHTCSTCTNIILQLNISLICTSISFEYYHKNYTVRYPPDTVVFIIPIQFIFIQVFICLIYYHCVCICLCLDCQSSMSLNHVYVNKTIIFKSI